MSSRIDAVRVGDAGLDLTCGWILVAVHGKAFFNILEHSGHEFVRLLSLSSDQIRTTQAQRSVVDSVVCPRVSNSSGCNPLFHGFRSVWEPSVRSEQG